MGNNSYKESWDDFGLNVLNVVLFMLNIFAITFYQPSITVLEILNIFHISQSKTRIAHGGHICCPIGMK